MADRFPFYKQLDSADCGATCLRMVSKFYGRHYTLEYLRQLSYLDREGVSLMGISDAAEKIGLRTLGVKAGFRRLMEDIPLPCVAHWQQDHIVVVYKVKGGKVFVADPKIGKIQLDEQDFLNGWISDVVNTEPQGILLLLETTPDFFAREGDKNTDRTGFGFLWPYLRQHRRLHWPIGPGHVVG